MLTVTKELAFDAAHRLIGHEGKCRHLHGHRYTVFITCEGKQDDVGRVIDFSAIKELVGTWIDNQLDHNTILNKDDKWVDAVWCEGDGAVTAENDLWGERKPYLLNCNPTAENIAMEIYRVASTLLSQRQIHVVSVRVDETPTCSATYTAPAS